MGRLASVAACAALALAVTAAAHLPPTPAPVSCAALAVAGVPCTNTPPPDPAAATTPCPAGAASCKLPDLIAQPRITIAGHAATWGGGVSLSLRDQVRGVPPGCAFEIVYTVVNIGRAGTGPPATFKNVLRVDGTTVAIDPNLTLAAAAHHLADTLVFLPAGTHQLTLDVNDGHAVPESNYANNHVALTYQLGGTCPKSSPVSAAGRGSGEAETPAAPVRSPALRS